MASIRQRVERLEKVAAPETITGKISLKIHLEEGDRCDIALQRELDEKGINLKEVGHVTFLGGLFFQYDRDLRNHPDWELIQTLRKEGRIWVVQFVKSKAQYEEYLRWEQEQKTNEGQRNQANSPCIQDKAIHDKKIDYRQNHLQRPR